MTLKLALRLVVAGLVLAAVLAAFGYRNATATPVVVRYRIAVEGLAAPLRIVQLSDEHLSYDMPPARVRAIVAQVNALAPDLVALTGDYVGGKLGRPPVGENLDDGIRPFAALRTRLGVFAVRGNHDNIFWSQQVIPRYGIVYLNNRWADAGPIVVAGMDDYLSGHPDAHVALAGVPTGKPVLMLMHNPDAWPQVPASVALTLAGHTHGGQIKLPLIGAPLTGSVNGQRFLYGLVVEGARRLIVSCGLGTTAIPIRFGTPPEIVEVTLYSVGRNSGTDR